MDKPILTWCPSCGTLQKKIDIDIDLNPNRSTWGSLADLCSYVWRCLNFSGPCAQCLTVHLSLPGTQVCIDIGNVKAVGVLCLLGISFGIGTYVLYKIYDRFVRPSSYRKTSIDSAHEKEAKTNVHNVCWFAPSNEEIMGNKNSTPAVYYKPGLGVSMYLPTGGNQEVHKRVSISEYHSYDFNYQILKSNLQTRNGKLNHVENVYKNFDKKGIYNNENGREASVQHALTFGQLNIEIDESGFVEDDVNADKFSLKGNFSPTSLCEKNFRMFAESGVDLETDVWKSQCSPKFDALNVNKNLKTSSMLLTHTVDEISSSTNQAFFSGYEGCCVQSTKSHVSNIHNGLVEPLVAEQFETDEDREQSSPLPYNTHLNRTPEKVFAKKLHQRLAAIASQGVNPEVGSNYSSRSSTPDSYLYEQIKDGMNSDKDNSISGISSPELELLHNESTEEILVVNTNTFNNIEEEIHVVEGEFENISQEIHALSSKYANVDLEQGTQILNKIFQQYPTYVHHIEFDENTDSRNASEIEDEADLSWDLENLGQLYCETMQSCSMNKRSVVNHVLEISDKADSNDSVSQDLSLQNHSVSCSVELDGSLYEDEFHLHLGTKAVPKDTEENCPIKNIGEKCDIHKYADMEWKGDTEKAKLMREAYRVLPEYCHYCHLRRIRGDNYCGIRSTLYQVLVNGLPTFQLWASKEKALEELSLAYNNQTSGINQWNFANRLSFTSENLLEVMQHCVTILYAKLNEIKQCSSYSEREGYVEKLLNSDPKLDLELMEGVKLLMSLNALHLHQTMEQGKDVPVFSRLMFARATSETVAGFVKNHLNAVGDSGGLEQVEMCLLGYTLAIRIRIYRLQKYGQEDFISHYPEDGTDAWPMVSLIAEDDRHYNIPVV